MLRYSLLSLLCMHVRNTCIASLVSDVFTLFLLLSEKTPGPSTDENEENVCLKLHLWLLLFHL